MSNLNLIHEGTEVKNVALRLLKHDSQTHKWRCQNVEAHAPRYTETVTPCKFTGIEIQVGALGVPCSPWTKHSTRFPLIPGKCAIIRVLIIGRLWDMSHGCICSVIVKIAKCLIKIETENLSVTPLGEPRLCHTRLLSTHSSTLAMLCLHRGLPHCLMLGPQKICH